jgi:hypothetical protein
LHAARGPTVELSEYNCFACHHDLTPADWRANAPKYYEGRKPGALVWQLPWPIGSGDVLTKEERAAVGAFAKGAGGKDAKPAIDALDAARVRLARGGPIPPGRFLDTVRVPAAELEKLDWDRACGLYYALRAAEADLAAEGKRPDVAKEFDALTRALALPGDRAVGGRRVDSPTQYAPGRVRAAFQRLQDRLRSAAGL